MSKKPIKVWINVDKINKEGIVKKKANYLPIVIWENDEPDQYGNTHAIQQDLPKELRDKGQKGEYLGNGKRWEEGETTTESTTTEKPQDDDLPF